VSRLLVTLVAIGVIGLLPTDGFGGGANFGGSLGMEFAFTPLPPADVVISTDINLGLRFAGGGVSSRTRLTWDGIEAAWLSLMWDLDIVEIRNTMRFDPCFSRYQLQASGGWCICEWAVIDVGGLLLLEDLADPCEPSDYTVGLALDLGFKMDYGFWLRSITGFGVWDLYHLVDDSPHTDVVAAPQWWFEEQLLGVGFRSPCFSVDSWMLFSDLGLLWARLGTAYRWSRPDLEVGSRLTWAAGPTFDSAQLIVSGTLAPVSVRSVTTFDLTGFMMQEIDVEVAFSGITIYTETLFDFSGLLQQVVGFELRF